jgi:hypothetical protein
MTISSTIEEIERPQRKTAMVRNSCEVRPHLRDALALLLQAFEYALDLEQSVWDLAVELEALRAARVTNSDLRWLAAKGYIEHAIETSGPEDRARRFRRTPLLSVTESTCVVLTRPGVAVAREALARDVAVGSNRPAPARRSSPEDVANRPRWDTQRRQLRVGHVIVKEFKLPSPNQETVLMALEEESWPPRIDDPLAPVPDIDSRRRLHDTIKALNRKQKQPLVRFMGDGSGEGIRWELRHHAAVTSALLTLDGCAQ